MVIDAEHVPRDSCAEADLCIIGAGAAGITIARELIGKRVRVCLLESGRFEPDESTQSLYDGETAGALIRSPRADYLRASRLRYFGGTTNHWYGQCLPFDEIDFENRPWVSHSGWPFKRDQLDQYYERALPICQIEPADFPARTSAIQPDPLLVLDESLGFAGRRFLFSPPTRFGQVYRKEISEAANLHLYLGANVVELEAHHDGEHIERVQVATLGGNRFQVCARFYVLATGGVENARLLLNSDRSHAGGLGNANDLVGRFFMEHPWATTGRLLYWRPRLDPLLTANLQHGGATFWPTEKTQRQLELLNAAIHVQSARQRADMTRDVLPLVTYGIDHLEEDAASDDESQITTFYIQVEQSPNPESRVTLTDERDALGQRKIRLDWRLSRLDQDNIWRVTELFARTLGRQRSGRVQMLADQSDPWSKGNVAWHHVGTTRMSQSPKEGVVNEDCRVHGIANLFVAGSSVFPTGSFINPTLTLTALALKLVDHLDERFNS